jgi:hypothetical protein
VMLVPCSRGWLLPSYFEVWENSLLAAACCPTVQKMSRVKASILYAVFSPRFPRDLEP